MQIIIDPKPRSIVNKLNCNNINNAIKQRIKTYSNDCLIDILPAAIGRFFVLSIFLSKSLSAISLKIHPALLIRTEPKKNNIK